MAKPKKTPIEYRNYELPVQFPIILLTGNRWHISEVKSGRLHFHNCLEIGLCHSQSGIIEFENTPCPFQADDVTVISSDIPHTTYSSPGMASRWSYLFIDTEELLRTFFPVDAMPHADILMDLEHNFRRIMPRDQYPSVYHLVVTIMKEIEQKKMNYQIAVRGLFLTLVTELMRIHSSQLSEISAKDSENALLIAPALDYIRANYMQTFTIEYLADLCHLSPTHFRRVFGSIMGNSPLEFINTTRILKAGVLLRITEDSILGISEQVGFRSISSFNRHFSVMMGLTPKEWRRKMSPLKQQSVLEYTGWM